MVNIFDFMLLFRSGTHNGTIESSNTHNTIQHARSFADALVRVNSYEMLVM